MFRSSGRRSTATRSSTGSSPKSSAIRSSSSGRSGAISRRASDADLDRPGVAGAEQCREITLALRACSLELLRHELVVDGPLDVAQDADRRRPDGPLSEPCQGERGARLRVMRVVHEQLRLVRHVDDFDATVDPLPHALLPLLAKADRLPVLQVDSVRLVVADEVERAVVVDVAVLEDLDE